MQHRICTIDPISLNNIPDTRGMPYIVEGTPDNDITIYFESEENRKAYLDMRVEYPASWHRLFLDNLTDEIIDEDHTEELLIFDNDGFIKNPASWDESIAQLIAKADGIPTLTPEHWAVIRTLREHYFKYGSLIPVRHICHENHLDRTRMDKLFDHSLKEAWRIAGLPNPGEEAKTYMQ